MTNLSPTNRSGRNHPCPICGRQTDSKCSWRRGKVHCYPGDSYHPPSHLKIGDTIQVNGNTWALVANRGGWSGSHWVFKPHQGSQPQQPQQRRRRPHPFERRLAQKLELLSKGLRLVIADATEALQISEDQLHLLSAGEVEVKFELINDQPRQLRLMIQALRGDELDWGRHIHELERLLVAVLHHQSMVKRFRRDCLGEEV